MISVQKIIHFFLSHILKTNSNSKRLSLHLNKQKKIIFFKKIFFNDKFILICNILLSLIIKIKTTMIQHHDCINKSMNTHKVLSFNK